MRGIKHGFLAIMIATVVFAADIASVSARTSEEEANNAILHVAGLKSTLPVASGTKDVKADGEVTGWTALLEEAPAHTPVAARFATSQAEEAVSVVKLTLPGDAMQKQDLSVSLWSPAITADSRLQAYRYRKGAWEKLDTSLRTEHIDIDLTGSAGDVIAITRGPAFRYVHNPAENPKVLEDAIVNPDAVYGFSPNPDSPRLREYVNALDWTDPAEVAAAKKNREDYHAKNLELYRLIEQLLGGGKDVETIARAVSRRRNKLRLESYNGDPDGLARVKKSNLDTYGNEEGPTADSLFVKYGSWQTVLEKALSANAGMDACLGLYDDYYDVHMLNR